MENIEKQGQLLPCPFCGGEASRRYTDSHPKGQEKLHIECDVCNARTDWQYSRAKLCVEDWWNQRTEPAELRELHKALNRVEQMFTDASDNNAFTRNHGDGANLAGLPPRDIYEVGRSTLLLALMGQFTAIKTDTIAAMLKEKENG